MKLTDAIEACAEQEVPRAQVSQALGAQVKASGALVSPGCWIRLISLSSFDRRRRCRGPLHTLTAGFPCPRAATRQSCTPRAQAGVPSRVRRSRGAGGCTSRSAFSAAPCAGEAALGVSGARSRCAAPGQLPGSHQWEAGLLTCPPPCRRLLPRLSPPSSPYP